MQWVQHKPDTHTWRMYVQGTRGHTSMKLYTTCFLMRGTMLQNTPYKVFLEFSSSEGQT
jgi:hypothetical protein